MAEDNKKQDNSKDSSQSNLEQAGTEKVEETTSISGVKKENNKIENSDNKSKEESKDKDNDLDLDMTEEKNSVESQLEELPEEIKKRLEQNKANKKNKQKTRKKKKKNKERVSVGNAYIKSTYNNTIVTLTDLSGNVLSWASAGLAGFKGPKKSTPYAAQIITRIAVEKAKQEYGLDEVSVFVKGVGTGRESAIRALNANGLNVTAIKDITPIPHNGCRQRKPRRV